MRVRLTRDARIRHKAGETVDVSPAEAGFLLSTGSAVMATAVVKPDAAEKPKKSAKKD